MLEKSAKNVEGYLLYDMIDDKYFFRVYNDSTKKNFTDYKLSAEDIKIKILSELSLYEEKENRLDWSSKYLKKDKCHE